MSLEDIAILLMVPFVFNTKKVLSPNVSSRLAIARTSSLPQVQVTSTSKIELIVNSQCLEIRLQSIYTLPWQEIVVFLSKLCSVIHSIISRVPWIVTR
jgi:hypothetical protein